MIEQNQNPAPDQNPLPQTSEIVTPVKSKKWLTLLVGLIALVAIVAVVLLFLRYIQLGKEIAGEDVCRQLGGQITTEGQCTLQVQAPKNTTNQTSQTDTSSLKTYNNQTYGFSMQIPKDWIVEEDGYNGQIYFTSPSLKKAVEVNSRNCELHIPNECFPEMPANDITLYLASQKDELSEVSTIKLGAETFEKYNSAGLYSDPYYEVKHGNQIYVFNSNTNQDFSLEQILSTLTFNK